MGDVQKKLQGLSEEYQKYQGGKNQSCSTLMPLANSWAELSTSVEARQKLESQQQENTTVQKVRHHALGSSSSC
jgi:prefoldin beta subunit